MCLFITVSCESHHCRQTVTNFHSDLRQRGLQVFLLLTQAVSEDLVDGLQHKPGAQPSWQTPKLAEVADLSLTIFIISHELIKDVNIKVADLTFTSIHN